MDRWTKMGRPLLLDGLYTQVWGLLSNLVCVFRPVAFRKRRFVSHVIPTFEGIMEWKCIPLAHSKSLRHGPGFALLVRERVQPGGGVGLLGWRGAQRPGGGHVSQSHPTHPAHDA